MCQSNAFFLSWGGGSLRWILSLAEVRPRKGQDEPRAEKGRHHLDETRPPSQRLLPAAREGLPSPLPQHAHHSEAAALGTRQAEAGAFSA